MRGAGGEKQGERNRGRGGGRGRAEGYEGRREGG